MQYYGRPEIVRIVERHKFWPAPAVDSAVLRVTLTGPAFEADPTRLFRLIKAGYGEKRKQLKNALAGGLNLSSDFAVSLIAAAKLPSTARAQELDLAAWKRLYKLAEKHDLLG